MPRVTFNTRIDKAVDRSIDLDAESQHVIGKRQSKQSRHDDLESEYTGAILVTVKKDGCNRSRGMQ